MRVLVTGGTGLLGNTVLRQLAEAGHETVALVRGDPDPVVFDGIDVESVCGDLVDADAVDRQVTRCDAVIHAAGLIHLGWTRCDESMRVNGEGTGNVVDSCLRHDRKLVHVGTVNVLAVGAKDRPADETTPPERSGRQVPCSYVTSKRAGVERVLRGVESGLRAVIVHPGFMLGPWDWKPSSGRMIIEVARRWRPISPSGGCSVCDSRDVAAATVDAITADVESGRQYILAGENWRYLQLWQAIATEMQVRGPIMPAGPLQRWIAGRIGDLGTRIGGESDLNSAAVAMSSQFHWYDSGRARAELGYQTRDVKVSLRDACEWIRAHHGKRI